MHVRVVERVGDALGHEKGARRTGSDAPGGHAETVRVLGGWHKLGLRLVDHRIRFAAEEKDCERRGAN